MDERTLESLQFAEALRDVAGHCQSPLGRERVEAARPLRTLAEVREALAPVSEAITLMDQGRDLSLDGLDDPRPVWDALGPEGHALDPEALSRVASFLEVVRRAAAYLAQVARDAPALGRLGGALSPAPHVERELRRCLRPDGSVADSASPDLDRLRSEIRREEARLRSLVDRLADELARANVLQDAYATQRGGRYVFPVRSGQRGKVHGIVHGASNTGETMFIEPAALVQATNDLEELRQAEAREIHRVCLALTRLVRPLAPALRADTDRLALLDSVWGRARAARRRGWAIPRLVERGPLRLLDAHHPLLHARAPQSSVPARVSLEEGDRVLLLSGPNAGGKTTLLKTIGLVAALVQSGVPAPVSPDSQLPLFTDFWADIGDAQDVTTGQSTFSAHARRMAEMLRHAREHSLVLLDELGTATDPAEGAALATAFLETLLRRGGLTIATCHQTPLKQWAHETPGARNASFSLDERTRQPTFRLTLDVPGASEAFVIAGREGVPPPVLERARQRLNRGEADLAALLTSLGSRERSLALREEELARRLKTLAEQEELARRRADLLREERRRWRENLARERENLLAELRERIERRIAELPAREAEVQRQRLELSRARREAQALQAEAAAERRRAGESLPPAPAREELLPGRRVFVPELRESGALRSVDLDRRRAHVLLDRGLIVETPLDALTRPPEESPVLAPVSGTLAPPAIDLDRLREEIARPAGAAAKKKKVSKKITRQAARGARDTIEPPPLGKPLAPAAGRATARGWRAGRARPAPAAKSAQQDAACAAGAPGAGLRFPPRGDISWQIDLHGKRVEEALEILDKYLDDAVVADLPYVKICHGQGTGALARAIREFLARHPHVAAWRFGQTEEGGGGGPIVSF